MEKFNNLGRKWLEELNNTYEHTIIDLESFDIESAHRLYSNIDAFQEEVNLEFSIILGKNKKFKFLN